MKGRSKYFVRGVGVALSMALLAACGSTTSNKTASSAAATTTSTTAASSSSTAAGTPQKGGTVVYSLGPQDINWYFPIRPSEYNTGVDSTAASAMYKSLFEVASNGKIDFAHSIASSITWNANGTVYTIDINPKWHWSDGSPVTASDVLFTWDIIKAASASTASAPWPYAGAGSGGVPNDIKSLKVVSPTEFTITLTKPVNQQWFEYDGLSKFIPLPAQVWNKYPKSPTQELNYITQNGTKLSFYKVVDGPFKIVSAVDKQAWTFVPNTSYDGHKPYISKLVLAYDTSGTAEANALRSGAAQIGTIPASDYNIRSQFTNDRFFTTNNYGYCRLFLNFGNPQVGSILNQLPVRQAMAMGIDQQGMIQKIYEGQAVIGSGPVPLDPPTFLAPQLEKPPYAFNPAAGKALLEKNGWTEKNGVMTNAKGQQLNFTMQYLSGSSSVLAAMQLIQSDWAQEGIKVALQPDLFATMVGMHVKSDAAKWQIQGGICWNWGASVPTGENLFKTGGAYNFYQFSNPSLDKLIDATISPQPTPSAQQAAMYAYDIAVAKDLPQIWMPKEFGLNMVAKNVHGVVSTVNNFTGAIYPQYWWVSQ